MVVVHGSFGRDGDGPRDLPHTSLRGDQPEPS